MKNIIDLPISSLKWLLKRRRKRGRERGRGRGRGRRDVRILIVIGPSSNVVGMSNFILDCEDVFLRGMYIILFLVVTLGGIF